MFWWVVVGGVQSRAADAVLASRDWPVHRYRHTMSVHVSAAGTSQVVGFLSVFIRVMKKILWDSESSFFEFGNKTKKGTERTEKKNSGFRRSAKQNTK